MAERPRAASSTRSARHAVLGLLILLLASGCAPGESDEPVRNQSLVTPREFGYRLGDTFAHHLRFELAGGYRLDELALPEPGRLTRWISLLAVKVETGLPLGSRQHAITLVYQVVNTPKAVLGIGTPPQSFRVIGPDGDFPVIVTSWGFTIAPITAPFGRAEGTLPPLRPALPPPLLDTRASIVRTAIITLACLALAGGLAYIHLLVPFLSRTRGPFAQACHQIRRLMRARGEANANYGAALTEAHRAFNATAGRVVFEHDLDRFFDEHERFRGLRSPIEAMFQSSTREFFRGAHEAQPGREQRTDPLRALLRLCRACRDRERGLP